MKRFVALVGAGAVAVVGSGAAVVLSPAVAGAVTDNLTIVNVATYNFPDSPFTQTVCVDGDFVANLAVAAAATLTVDTGTDHTVTFRDGADQPCEEPDHSAVVNLGADDVLTVGLIYQPGEGGIQVAQWPENTACYGTDGRISLRNGAYFPGDVDLRGEIDGVDTLIAEGAFGDTTADATLPAGTVIGNAYITTGGNPEDVITELGDLTVPTDGELQIYLAGGADGGTGAFAFEVSGTACGSPTSTTSTTSTTAPSGAAEAQVTPAFTG